MKKISLSLWCLLTLRFCALAAPADTISLNGTWKFKTDLYKKGTLQSWQDPAISKDNWDNMEVPGNWDTYNEYADYAGDAWYSYTFKASDDWNGRNVRLVFQSVYNDSEIWLNGAKLGESHLGFLQFYFDVSRYLLPGKSNQLVVKVNNVFKRGAIWNWGGIRRPVWLEVTGQNRINRVAITAVPDISARTANVNARTFIENLSEKETAIDYSVDIWYNKKNIYASGIVTGKKVAAGGNAELVSNIALPASKTHLWHFDHPELYTLRVSIYRNKVLLHSITERFGIRKIEVSGLKLLLNGEEIKPVGFNLVAEDRVTGNSLPADRIHKMVDMMKEAGANMARVSHMPLPKEFLDYLDEKGIMTFEEVSLWGKDVMVDPAHPLPKLWLEKLVSQQYNHPSVIGWSVGNEIGSVKNNPHAVEYIQGAIEHAKNLDPSRLAVYVSNSVQSQPSDPARFADMILLNSYGNWAVAAAKAHENVPGKPIFFSEFGENLNDEDPDKSQLDFNKMLAGIKKLDYVVGASLWTFNDYRSSYWSPKTTWITPVSGNRTWGVVNTFLQKKKSYPAIQKAFLPVTLSGLKVERSASAISGSISIQPNSFLQFPAYQLNGYSLYVSAQGIAGAEQSSTVQLPLLKPGDEQAAYFFKVPSSTAVQSLRIQFKDPQQYSRYDTVIFFYPPLAPVISAVHTAATSARIVFQPVVNASRYSLKYGINEPDQESPATINNFIELSDLKELASYKFRLIAHNNAGSASSEVSVFKLDEDELPPVIWGVEPAKNALFISFSSNPPDYRYEVEYGLSAGKYDTRLTLNTKGVLKIPGLEAGKTYYMRLRRLMQWGFASEWTNELQARPN